MFRTKDTKYIFMFFMYFNFLLIHAHLCIKNIKKYIFNALYPLFFIFFQKHKKTCLYKKKYLYLNSLHATQQKNRDKGPAGFVEIEKFCAPKITSSGRLHHYEK